MTRMQPIRFLFISATASAIVIVEGTACTADPLRSISAETGVSMGYYGVFLRPNIAETRAPQSPKCSGPPGRRGPSEEA